MLSDLLQKEGFEVSVYKKDNSIPRNELIRKVKKADGVILFLWINLMKRLFSQMQQCKVISNYAVGYNNIHLKAAKEKQLLLQYPDILTNATADLTMALVLTCSRNIVPGYQLMSSKKWKG